MSKQVLRLGDPGSHGNGMISSASKTKSEGIFVCRDGDIYDCPIHGPNPIISSAVVTIVEGKQIGLDQDRASCGGIISSTGVKWDAC